MTWLRNCPPRSSTAQLDGSPRRKFYTGRKLSRVRSIDDLRARTHKLMPRFVLEYLEGGAGEEATLRRERTSFAEWRIMPRTLVYESDRSVSGAMLGREVPLPLAVAPTGLNGIFCRHGDLALAKGAARAGVPFIQSTMSNDRLEDVAKIPDLRHWWQLYVFGDDGVWKELVDRADAAGCEALVVTTNAQIFGRRSWDQRTRTGSGWPTMPAIANAALHPRWAATTLSHGLPQFANVRQFVPEDKQGFFASAHWIRDQLWRDLTWEDVERIRERWTKPLLLKGILNVEDVKRAKQAGVDGVVLSSHGGRQADWAVAPLDLLPKARDAAGEMQLYLSGGIRHGSDMVKALALGADAVLTGRATLYGLCAHGAAGVHRAIEVLKREMSDAMGQYGVPDLAALGPDLLARRNDLPL